jgi:hypothetical protein
MGDAAQPAQRNVYDPIKGHNAYGNLISPRTGTVVQVTTVKGKPWNAIDAYGPNAHRRHRGFAPNSGDLKHLPGNQPHHYVFTPPFKDIKAVERYDRASSRIGSVYNQVRTSHALALLPCKYTCAAQLVRCLTLQRPQDDFQSVLAASKK